jgi:hypothetical protein
LKLFCYGKSKEEGLKCKGIQQAQFCFPERLDLQALLVLPLVTPISTSASFKDQNMTDPDNEAWMT